MSVVDLAFVIPSHGNTFFVSDSEYTLELSLEIGFDLLSFEFLIGQVGSERSNGDNAASHFMNVRDLLLKGDDKYKWNYKDITLTFDVLFLLKTFFHKIAKSIFDKFIALKNSPCDFCILNDQREDFFIKFLMYLRDPLSSLMVDSGNKHREVHFYRCESVSVHNVITEYVVIPTRESDNKIIVRIVNLSNKEYHDFNLEIPDASPDASVADSINNLIDRLSGFYEENGKEFDKVRRVVGDGVRRPSQLPFFQRCLFTGKKYIEREFPVMEYKEGSSVLTVRYGSQYKDDEFMEMDILRRRKIIFETCKREVRYTNEGMLIREFIRNNVLSKEVFEYLACHTLPLYREDLSF